MTHLATKTRKRETTKRTIWFSCFPVFVFFVFSWLPMLGVWAQAPRDADWPVNGLAPGWIATAGPRQYWESLTPAERLERGVPSRLLTTDQIADAVRPPRNRHVARRPSAGLVVGGYAAIDSVGRSRIRRVRRLPYSVQMAG